MEGWMDELLLKGNETPYWVSLRQEQALDAFVNAINRARDEAAENGSLEIGAQHLWDGVRALQNLTGEMTPEEVLEGIFSRFCIGK
jgi:tRNA modification GTPase